MLTKRFLISWIVSSVVMFGAFYMWHGMFLTDFTRLSYPKEIFLVVSSLVYLVIGLILNKGYEVKMLERFHRKPLIRGTIAGAGLGFVLFIVTMVLGVSFSGSQTLGNLLLDVSWQVIEQALGGAAVGIVHMNVYDEAFFRSPEGDQ